MTAAEMQTVAERSLGSFSGAVRAELRVLADHLRPDEQLLALAAGTPGILTPGAGMLAATDQRLLSFGTSSGCETIEYDALISVTDDLANHELSLVTPDRVLTLCVLETPGASQIVATIKARIGEDRLHERAGAAEYRQVQIAFLRAVMSAFLLVGAYLLLTGLVDHIEDWRADDAPERLERGACLDIRGQVIACKDAGAIFVILGPREAENCPRSSPTLVRSVVSSAAQRRELSRFCVGVSTG